MVDLTPPVLEGRHVRLEPLTHGHKTDLITVALDPELWRFTPTQIHSAGELDAYVDAALSGLSRGTDIPFATVDRSTGRAIGCTRFGNIDPPARRVEIGWTWLGRDFQRRAFNTEAKLLMLAHAFERMDCIRVELRVDSLNAKSRKAVERLGAQEERTLRHHMIMPDGRLVDWVYYGILRDEWPSVRARLEEKLRSHDI